MINLEKMRFNKFSDLLVSNLKASNRTDYSKVIRESYETYMNSISIKWNEPNSLIKEMREYNFQEMVNKNESFFRICDINDYDTKANCSGNFHFGVEYEGNGLIIQELYCKNSLTCTKDGSIIKNTDWR